MANMTTTQKLNDARTKLHQLMTGSLRVIVRDGDSTMEFTPANRNDLRTYIQELESAQAVELGSTPIKRRPIGVIF